MLIKLPPLKERLVEVCQPQVNFQWLEQQKKPTSVHSLRLLSFNIQVGITTASYKHYLTRSWQHILPNHNRQRNLTKIAALLNQYDIVALQEVDGGSLRSGYINQVEYLSILGCFPFWYQQLNRNLGHFAQHSNGLLSRFQPHHLENHKLPGPAGRGAILMQVGEGKESLAIVMMHLALGSRTRNKQLAYIREITQAYKHVVLMGDMNTPVDDLLLHSPLNTMDLRAPQALATFPSWNPQRCLDHILITSELDIENVRVLPERISDHLPVALDLKLPTGILQLN